MGIRIVQTIPTNLPVLNLSSFQRGGASFDCCCKLCGLIVGQNPIGDLGNPSVESSFDVCVPPMEKFLIHTLAGS
jgi:hypothetical protein